MDFKEITIYPEIIIDLAVFLVLAAAMILLSKCVWDWKEQRRLRREMAAYIQRKEDEAAER